MFGKIFDSIYDGSLRKDWKALVVFQQLLVLGDEAGFVDMTPEAISARTTIPLEIIKHGIAELEKPDPDSRSKEEDGRRIVLVNPEGRTWGWRIVNHATYRGIRTKDQLRNYWRDQKGEQRELERLQKRTIRLKMELNRIFKRRENSRWTFLEESTLAEIARREECLEELAQIETLRETNARYFPQSVERLLSSWNTMLDRSRINPPKQKYDGPPHVRMRVIEDLIANHPANPESRRCNSAPTQEMREELKFLRNEKRTIERAIAGLK